MSRVIALCRRFQEERDVFLSGQVVGRVKGLRLGGHGRRITQFLGGLVAALAVGAPAALADPCKAIPDNGPLPAYLTPPGQGFLGRVVYIGDGDSLCVEVGGPTLPFGSDRGANWVEVRLADFNAPELAGAGGREARDALARIAKGRRVACVAGRRTYDRIAAWCFIKRVSLGDLMRRAGVREGGRGR